MPGVILQQVDLVCLQAFQGTFNGFTGERSGDKIDAVLVSDGWTVRDAEIVRTDEGGRYPSDHFPVSAVVERDRARVFPPPGSVGPEQAAVYLGHMATVCGHVVTVRFVPEGRQPTILDFGRSHPDQAFVVIIWSLNRARFPRPLARAYQNKNVCVYGRVGTYRGRWPAIVAREPTELWVAD